MKGLILSGGAGTRLRPLTYTRAKQLLPLANKPVLFYAIDALVGAGIRTIGVIVGDTHTEIEEAVTTAGYFDHGVDITFIRQEAPLGLAHAVKTAQSFLGVDKFVMFLGDNLIGESLSTRVSEFSAPDCSYHSYVLLHEVANPSQFGVAELQTESALESAGNDDPPSQVRIRRLVEKPKDPASNLALVGVYFFDSSIFDAVEAIEPSARGELEITDAIQWLIDHGYDVRAQLLTEYWIDTGKMEDILDANRQVLLSLASEVAPTATISASSELTGAVIVQDGAVIENSVIRGPAIVGKRTVIRNSYIGPFTSIYHDVMIESCEVEYSVVLEHSRICDVRGRIEESLIGRHADVHTSTRKPRSHRLMLGDHSRVDILSS